MLLAITPFWLGWVAVTMFYFLILINWTGKDPKYNNKTQKEGNQND